MIPVETAKLRINEFHHRHGGECILDSGYYWYPDGAFREEDPLGLLCEPPDPGTDQGEFDLLHRKLRFHQAKLNRAVLQFESLRDSFFFSAPPADEAAAVKKLEELRQTVEARQEEVRHAEKERDNSRIGRARKGMQESAQQQRAKQAEWQSKLKRLRI